MCYPDVYAALTVEDYDDAMPGNGQSQVLSFLLVLLHRMSLDLLAQLAYKKHLVIETLRKDGENEFSSDSVLGQSSISKPLIYGRDDKATI